MSNQAAGPGGLGSDEMQSARFAQLVMQQTNMAFMLLGKVPHPESGKEVRDLDAAQFFIDQLEMIEAKTKGNLNPPEATLLKQSLMSLHLAFVEAVNAPAPEAPAPAAEPTAPAAGPKEEPPLAPAPSEESAPKRFSKKYS